MPRNGNLGRTLWARNRRDPTMPKISAYILTYNEAEKIAAAVSSVLWADEVVVVDFGEHRPHRGDRNFARRARGQRAVQRFRRLAQPRDRGLRQRWIFSLDADERCTEEVRDEILALIAGSRRTTSTACRGAAT